MTAALTRTAIIQIAIERGIADYILSNFFFTLTGSDDEIDHARYSIMQWARKASPHIAACIEEDLRRAAEHRAADIKDLLDTVIDALWQEESTPAQDTEATPEQIHHAVAMRQALADVVTDAVGRGQLADRIERVAADRLADLYSASIPAGARRRSRATDHIGAFLTAAWLRGDEILAGTAEFPATRRPPQAERQPVRCEHYRR